MVNTWSKFFYDFEITADNRYINFDEGSGELTAELKQGRYSLTDGLQHIADQMSDVGTQGYIVSLNRVTRIATIQAAAPFDLLVATGSAVASSGYPLAGFTGADRTGANSYAGNALVGREYVPQFKLQDFVDPEDNVRTVDSTVRKAADGSVEVVTFGEEKILKAQIKFATNIRQDGRVIRNNPSGYEDLREFMRWCIRKAPVELMLDENAPGVFLKLMLESTPESKDGIEFRLKELYTRNLPGYFETGILDFRVLTT